MSVPEWFPPISWSTPIGVEALRSQRHLLPNLPGVYVFTNYHEALERNTGVLYVGKAKRLLNRVPSYLVDPGKMLVLSSRSGAQRLNSSLKHSGKVKLLVEIQQKSRGPGPSGIWIRWFATPDASKLEVELITYLKPAYNTQGTGGDWDDD